jgi:methyl halide transferase
MISCCTTTCDLPLGAKYWDEQYLAKQTGWDLKQISPPLEAYIQQIADKNIRILIAGCGSAYEAEFLFGLGFDSITLVDISEVLVAQLKEKFAETTIEVYHQDIFEHKGSYDLILEQTLFCALDPSLRKRYVSTMSSLLSEKGKLVGLLFDRTFEQQGPHFGGSKEEYIRLFSPYFSLEVIEPCFNSIAPRAGSELFINFSKKNLI